MRTRQGARPSLFVRSATNAGYSPIRAVGVPRAAKAEGIFDPWKTAMTITECVLCSSTVNVTAELPEAACNPGCGNACQLGGVVSWKPSLASVYIFPCGTTVIEPDDNIALDTGVEEEWARIRELDADDASRLCTQADTSRNT